MNTSMRLRSTLALLAGGAILAVGAVSAQAHGPQGPQPVEDAGSGDVVLRRDGTEATTLVTGLSPAPLPRRGDAEATDAGPTASADGFDWGDAAIGTAAGILMAAAAIAGSAAIRGRPTHAAGSTAASQGV
jgi:hypothetical protein